MQNHAQDNPAIQIPHIIIIITIIHPQYHATTIICARNTLQMIQRPKNSIIADIQAI
jgi:hypothetical protein